MKIHSDKQLLGKQYWGHLAILLITATIIAACGGSTPSSTPEPPLPPTEIPAATATVAPNTPEGAADIQPDSPLEQGESPLAQPDSPLTTSEAVAKPRNEEEALKLAANLEALEPSEGLGTLSGVVYSVGSIPGAVPGTQVYLLKAEEDVDGNLGLPPVYLGPKPENGDVFGFTSAVGQLQLDKISPGDYFMAVWTIYDYRIVYPTGALEAPMLITINEGDQLNLGLLYVNWP